MYEMAAVGYHTLHGTQTVVVPGHGEPFEAGRSS
jgi:hypothetical protein